MKKIILALLVLFLGIGLTGCNTKNNYDEKEDKLIKNEIEDDKYKISNDEKQKIIKGFDTLCERKHFIIEDIIYLHKIKVEDGAYIYGSEPFMYVETKYAYESKVQITYNGENSYIYYYFYLEDDEREKDYVQFNKEGLLKPDVYYFVDKNNNRLDYDDIDKDWIDENIIINY